MKLRMLAAFVALSFSALPWPAWAQKADLPGLEGIWYSCANHEDNFDLIPEKHQVLFDKQGKLHSGKYQVEGNQIKFAGRKLVMTEGELDEGTTHWVNGRALLATRCPGSASQSQSALTGNGAAIPEKPEIKEKNEQQQAALPTAEAQNPAPAPAEAVVMKDGKTQVRLATGNFVKLKGGDQKERFEYVTLEPFQGQEAISFSATYFCREALLYGQVGYCGSGRIYITERTVAFQKDKGKIEFMSLRSATTIKSEGGREGDTFSIYDNRGKRYRFGSAKFDSPALMYLQAAITGFPNVYKQVKQLPAGQPVLTASAAALPEQPAQAVPGVQATQMVQERSAPARQDQASVADTFSLARDADIPGYDYGRFTKKPAASDRDRTLTVLDLATLQQRADGGDAVAQVELAIRYGAGRDLSQDFTQAAAWFRKAADQGNSIAQNDLAYLHAKGKGVPWDNAAALKLFRSAADHGNTSAQNNLAYMYRKAMGIPQDYAQAMAWNGKAADQGDTEALVILGSMYHGGFGVEDFKRALECYQKAADLQDPNGEIGLAMLYDLGHGVRGNSKNGFMLIQHAANRGYGPAQSMLAGRYDFGVGTRKDHAQALAWYRKAADQNYLPAVMKVADIYRDGDGVPKDDAKAAAWYNRASAEYLKFAEQGSLYAQSQLADMYRDGHGVRQDSKQAAVWYARAADQGDAAAKIELKKEQAKLGDATAQVELARMYRSGAGVPQDYQQAANWLSKAAAQGNEDAKKDLVAVNQEIVKQQAAQAQEQAKSKASDRRSWIALAGLAGASVASGHGADAATVLKAGLATAAVAAKVTSNNGGQDQTTTALTSLAQAANGQATNPIQQTANEQIAAIHALADAKTPQERAAVQQRLAAQQAFKQAAALAQGTGDKFNCVGASGADSGYNNGCQLVPGTNSTTTNGSSGGGTGGSTAGNSSSGAAATDGNNTSSASANTSTAGGSSSLSSNPNSAEKYDPNRHYSGPGAGMVATLLARSPGWSCPSSSAASFTYLPPVEQVCMRDSYVIAAVTEAYGAECEARLGRDKEAAADAKAMLENVANAKKMCSHAIAIGGSKSSCSTLDLVPCD